MRKLAIAAAILASTAIAGTAQAAITVYTTQASYLAAISNPGVDTYNNLTPGAPLAASLSRTAGSYSYTVASGNTSGEGSLYGAGSNSDAWLSTNSNLDAIIYSGFASGVRGVGGFFFGSDINGLFTAAPLGLTVTATDASGTVTRSLISPTTSTFLGFVSTGALSQVTVAATVTGSSYWATANNLTLGAAATPAVPEPASWAMMILGMGAVGFAMRRRGQVKTSVTFA